MPYVSNNGVRIHYQVEGQGAPLMLVHGMGGSMDSWRSPGYVEELSKNHLLILIDMRGFGSSDKPHDPVAYGFQPRIEDLVAVLDDLGIARTGYFGYSMGGRVGFRIPVHAPNRFSYLILGGMGYPITGTEEKEDGNAIQTQRDLETAIKVAPDKPMEFIAAVREKRTGVTLSPDRKAILLANDALVFLVYVRASQSIVNLKAGEVLPNIGVPCLLFAGEGDPWFSTAQKSADLIPGARFVSLPELDHVEAFQRSDLVLPHVKEFLSGMSEV